MGYSTEWVGRDVAIQPDDDWALEVGRLTIQAASAEEWAYRMGEELGLALIRDARGVTLPRRLRGFVESNFEGLHARRLEPAEIVRWCREMEERIEDRHVIIHSHYFLSGEGEGPYLTLRRQSRYSDGNEAPLSLEDLVKLRLTFTGLRERAVLLWIALHGDLAEEHREQWRQRLADAERRTNG